MVGLMKLMSIIKKLLSGVTQTKIIPVGSYICVCVCECIYANL